MCWRSVRNLVCVRLDNMGDVIMTTPAIHALKTNFKQCRLTLLTSRAGGTLAPVLEDVDEVVTFDAPWIKAAAEQRDGGYVNSAVRQLREKKYDAAVIFTTYSQNPLPAAMLAFLADIPFRLAFCRENPYQLLTHWVHEQEPESGVRHEVERQLALVGTIGCSLGDTRMRLRAGESQKRSLSDLLNQMDDFPQRRWFIVHPGATAPSRRYPAGHFAEAINLIAQKSGFQAVFTGDESEAQLIEGIRRVVNGSSISLAGRLTVPELVALVAQAPLVVTNNTVTSHIASATETPVVVLYALTNMQHIPWRVPCRVLYHDVSCKLCYKSVCPLGHNDCLRKVSPEEVCKAALELLEL
jgi:lipopolysaccharide heptosyltransferase II